MKRIFSRANKRHYWKVLLYFSAKNVRKYLNKNVYWQDIFNLNIKEWTLLVITVAIKLHIKEIWQNIFNLNIMVWNMFVISVIISIQIQILWESIFNLCMKVSNMAVKSVINSLQYRLTWRGIWRMYMKDTSSSIVINATKSLQHRAICTDTLRICIKFISVFWTFFIQWTKQI